MIFSDRSSVIFYNLRMARKMTDFLVHCEDKWKIKANEQSKKKISPNGFYLIFSSRLRLSFVIKKVPRNQTTMTSENKVRKNWMCSYLRKLVQNCRLDFKSWYCSDSSILLRKYCYFQYNVGWHPFMWYGSLMEIICGFVDISSDLLYRSVTIIYEGYVP